VKDYILNTLVNHLSAPALNNLHVKLNRLTNRLRGIGNHSSMKLSGEAFCMEYVLKHYKIESIFDVGAHDGEYILNLRQRGFHGNAYAFEPHPVTYQRLEAYCQTDAKTTAFPFGLSNQKGTLTIYDRKPTKNQNGTHHASLYSDVITSLHKSDVEAIDIQLETLDEFVSSHDIKQIDLLKIDTEGHEFSIIQGGKATIESGKVKLIQFEFGQMNVVSRVFFKDFYDALSPKYRIFRLLPNNLQEIKHYDPETCEIFHYQNFLAIRKD
jgi:FkbM family methyltransferase